MPNEQTVEIPEKLVAGIQRMIDKYPEFIRYTSWNTLEKYVVGVIEDALEANEDFAQSNMLKEYLAEEDAKKVGVKA